MAAAASRREGNYTDIGVAGRKTGLAITNVARDDDGMEDMDAFFSPDKSMHHTAADFPASDTTTGNASASMDLVHSSSSGGANLLNALSAHRNPSYRQHSLPPARRSPSRISVSGTPRRASSVAPGSSPGRRMSSPVKPTPSRKLDFGKKRVVLSPSRPAVNGAAKRPGGLFGSLLNGSSSSSSPPHMKQKNGGATAGKRGLEKIKDVEEEEESRIEIPPIQTQHEIPSTQKQRPTPSPAVSRSLVDPKKHHKKRGLLASKKNTKAFSFELDDDEDSEEDEAGQQIQEESLLDSMAQENFLLNVDEDEEMPVAPLELEEEEEREPSPVKKPKAAAKKGKDIKKAKPKEKPAPKQEPKKSAVEKKKTTKTVIPETDDVEPSEEEEDLVVPSSPPVRAKAPVKGKASKASAPPPKQKGEKAKPVPVEEDEEEEEEEKEEPAPPKKPSKPAAKSRTKKAAPVQESEAEEEEEPEAPPPPKKPTKTQKAAAKKRPLKTQLAPEPEEESEEEEEEASTPPKKPTKSRAKSPVPTKPTKKPTSKSRKASSSSSSTPKDDELAMAAAEPSAALPKSTRTTKFTTTKATKSSKPTAPTALAASQPSPSISTRPPRNARATSVDVINRQRIIHEPPPPTRSPSTDANGIRRSSRARVAPLQFWKNEKIRYALQRRESGPAMPAIQEIIRVESDSEEERKRVSRKRARKPAANGEEDDAGAKKRKKTVKGADTKKEKEEEDEAELNPGNPEPWERFTDDTGAVGIKLGSVRPHPSMQTDNADNEMMETEIAYSAERILTADVAMGNFRFVKTVTRAGFGTGVLTFRHKEEKRPKNSGTMFLVFYVVAGRASVRIADTQFRVGRGGQFMVPPGNMYSISNEFEPELKLFFAQHAEVEPFDLDNEEE
ncbi:hypothetical protein EX30DRAFT_374400 [Ascodesmis nigricans]|uniref:Mif2/CENP-C cupin domain-containing protein n=1 Tax=Ascodesmis nigricans TaxID=341454 RepID=A0A4S2ML78_9PEZI|nr:hypothetical protein EX30DRAFT_374400 [Ascodesmis nigricans]